MLRQLKVRNTITIPQPVLEHVHAKAGDYFEIQDDGHRIYLVPKVMDERFSDEEWDKIEKLANEKGKQFKTGKSALHYLSKISKPR